MLAIEFPDINVRTVLPASKKLEQIVYCTYQSLPSKQTCPLAR